MKRKKIFIIIAIIIMIAIEQIVKLALPESNIELIKGILEITNVKNTGAAFGIGQDNLLTYIVTDIVVLGLIIRFMILQKDNMEKQTKIALSLIIAGGISNLIDRVLKGGVIDYIKIVAWDKFPIINLADIFIFIGFIIFAWSLAKTTMETRKLKIGVEKSE